MIVYNSKQKDLGGYSELGNFCLWNTSETSASEVSEREIREKCADASPLTAGGCSGFLKIPVKYNCAAPLRGPYTLTPPPDPFTSPSLTPHCLPRPLAAGCRAGRCPRPDAAAAASRTPSSPSPTVGSRNGDKAVNRYDTPTSSHNYFI